MREKPKRYVVILHGIMAVLGLTALVLGIRNGDFLKWSAKSVLQIFTFGAWPVIFAADLKEYLAGKRKQ